MPAFSLGSPLSISRDLAPCLAKTRSAEEVYECAHRAVLQICPKACLMIWLWDEPKDRAFLGYPRTCDHCGHTPRAGGSQVHVPQFMRAIQSALHGSKLNDYFPGEELCPTGTMETALAIPVDAGKLRLIFVVLLEKRRRQKMKASNSDAIQSIAHFAASTIAQIQLSAANSVLSEISTIAHGSIDQDDFLNSTVQSIQRVFRANGCSILLINPQRERLVLAATTGIVSPADNTPVKHVEYGIGEGCTGWIWKTRRTLRLINVADEAELRLVDPQGKLRMATKSAERRSNGNGLPYSFLGCPIELASPKTKERRVLGVIRVHKESRDDPFLAPDEKLLETIANLLAPAIERWRFITETNWRLRLQRGLFDIIEAMHHDDQAHLDTILDKIATAALSLFESHSVLVFVAEGETNTLVLKKAVGAKPKIQELSIPFGSGLSGVAAVEKKTLLSPDVRKDHRYIEVLSEVRSEANVPILFGKDCLGVLTIESLEPGAFRPSDVPTIETLETFAKQAAIALHRAAVLEERDIWRQHLVRTTEMLTASSVASGLAHELKNGLAIISGMADSLQRVPGIKMDKDNLDRLTQIKSESSSLFTLTKRLMELTKLGQPRLELIHLNDLVKKRIELLTELVETKDMKLVKSLDHRLDKPASGDGHPILLDPRQIEQVLTNLILNAVDASFPRQNIEVSTKLLENGWATFSVRDFGVGISTEQRRHLFEMFYTTKEHGFGVGLHVARLLVEQNHGGNIEVESKENKGTLFTVTLPEIR